MTRLSVNINKAATLRNARGGNLPDLVQFAKDCEAYGAQGITIHPRPDERHIRYSDVPLLKEVVTTEYNIEGNPNRRFLDLVLANQPEQCTLVPDAPGILTSNEGWDTVNNASLLKDVVAELKAANIRVSLFVNADEKMVEGAKEVGADRVEFYTGTFAEQFSVNKISAVEPHKKAGKLAQNIGVGINAGHDLSLENLNFYCTEVKNVLEVSIGHALICDALYYGLQNVIPMYLRKLH